MQSGPRMKEEFRRKLSVTTVNFVPDKLGDPKTFTIFGMHFANVNIYALFIFAE